MMYLSWRKRLEVGSYSEIASQPLKKKLYTMLYFQRRFVWYFKMTGTTTNRE